MKNIVITLPENLLPALRAFLERTDLKGHEVLAFVEIAKAVQTRRIGWLSYHGLLLGLA